ncbi:MAG: hypothetical protein U0T74_06625 [Chitinophagales bacterium]
MSNILFLYMYRDGANYKNHGEVVFANPQKLELSSITTAIESALIDGAWFYVKPWNLPDLHFEKWDDDIDHTFHEFESVSYTNELPTDNRTIEQFLLQIKNG